MTSVETYLAGENDLYDEDAAKTLIAAAKSIDIQTKISCLSPDEKMHLNKVALDCRVAASFIFENIDMPLEIAKSLDLAGNSAFYIFDPYLKSDLKERAARIYAAEGHPLEAAYAYLHAAEAIMYRRSAVRNLERLDCLMGEGLLLAHECQASISPEFVSRILEMYDSLQISMLHHPRERSYIKRGSYAQQTDW